MKAYLATMKRKLYSDTYVVEMNGVMVICVASFILYTVIDVIDFLLLVITQLF